nr:hypothetical protein [Candidatus Sigynarchaeota archaeon]
MRRKETIDKLFRLRDIARAHEAREGTIAVLAERYRTSTRTVQEAIKHGAAEWEAKIADLARSLKIKASPDVFEYAVAILTPVNSPKGVPVHVVEVEGRPGLRRVEGTIGAAMSELGKEGWIVSVLLNDPKEPRKEVLLRRPLNLSVPSLP